MIFKSFNLNKKVFEDNCLFLFYGDNTGHKEEVIKKLSEDINKKVIEEKDILINKDDFYNDIYSGSLFDSRKIIIIQRATDKLMMIIEKIDQKLIQDIKIIINSPILEKRSKLRSYFEKDKDSVCVAFYPDTTETLLRLAKSILNLENIKISNYDLNMVVNKSSGNRLFLNNELRKLILFSKNKKQLLSSDISKLINLTENHNISELVNNCLAQNKKKTLEILNENNFNDEESIMILRVLSNKLKQLLKLRDEYEINKDITKTISSAKPPIFWKDKNITEKQIKSWRSDNLKPLIYKINEIELFTKKNLSHSVRMIHDLIIEQLKMTSNS